MPLNSSTGPAHEFELLNGSYTLSVPTLLALTPLGSFGRAKDTSGSCIFRTGLCEEPDQSALGNEVTGKEPQIELAMELEKIALSDEYLPKHALLAGLLHADGNTIGGRLIYHDISIIIADLVYFSAF